MAPRSWLARLAWPALGLLLLCLPLGLDGRHALGLASQMGIAVLACLSFHVLWGQGGMLSFGHAVYTGAGAYLCMHSLQALSAHAWPLPVALLPLLAGVPGATVERARAILAALVAGHPSPTLPVAATAGDRSSHRLSSVEPSLVGLACA